MGTMWRLREKMLLMRMSLGAGVVSARVIVPHHVLFSPCFWESFACGMTELPSFAAFVGFKPYPVLSRFSQI